MIVTIVDAGHHARRHTDLPVRRVVTDGPRRVEGGKRHRYRVDLLRALGDPRAMKT